jgi:hypothetical protein
MHAAEVVKACVALQPAHGKKELQSCYSGSSSWKRPYSLGVRPDRKIVSSYLPRKQMWDKMAVGARRIIPLLAH